MPTARASSSTACVTKSRNRRHESRSQPVDRSRAFSGQRFVFAAWSLCVLLRERRHSNHSAVARFSAQPADEGAHQQGGVEAVSLCPFMFARHRDACRVNDMHVNIVLAKPPSQPKAVAAGLVGHCNAKDFTPALDCLIALAMEQPQQRTLIWVELLQRRSLNARHQGAHEPTGLTELYHCDE